MGGRYRREGRPSFKSSDVLKAIAQKAYQARKTDAEVAESNQWADTSYQTLMKNQWVIVAFLATFWIVRLTITSNSDPITMLVLSNSTISITNAVMSILATSMGMLAFILWTSLWSQFVNSKDRDLEDKKRHLLLIVISFILMVFTSGIASLILAITMFVSFLALERLAKKLVGTSQNSKRYFTTSYAVACCLGQMGIYLLAGGADLWLPSEKITTTQETFVGYVVSSDNDNTTVVLDKTRGTRIYRNDKITDRTACIKTKDSNPWGKSLPYLLNRNHEEYPICDPAR